MNFVDAPFLWAFGYNVSHRASLEFTLILQKLVVISFVGEGEHFGYGTCMSHPNKIYILLEPMRRPKKAHGVDGFVLES